MKAVTFKHKTWDVAANLHLPPDFDETNKYPAVVVAHPISSCKEQTAAIYAGRLAGLGYLALAFDASTQGASGGLGQYLEDPATRVEDFRCAVDYLVTLGCVDENRIGVLGICGGGGYAVNAAMTERRFKAVGTIVGANYGRLAREGDLSADAAIKAMEGISRQRTAEARGAGAAITTYIPRSQAELDAAGIKDVDVVEAVDYYTTSRGQKPGSPNKLNVVSTGAAFNWDAFHLADRLLTQPLQVIIGGGQTGLFGSYRDGFELFDKARSEKKDIFVVPGATHYDLYDKPDCVDQAMARLAVFYGENL
ncbi:alpha/beta hydrolase [Phreatobacter sp. AB_2022a]|uniref:alpha/beta hydrolase n=1 Tax=Phreatobacter sp. AB_2022a TaxID=3003134 RepID=UPI0022876C23|nr:alpha/beta hydrolase [Phreatobacter sp. AB_2022a]MCZ0737963.1 alpha/beta hydrolase [Phreatobacter sp. AB_2022a]